MAQETTDKFSDFAHTIMEHKYSHTLSDGNKETWENIAYRVTKNVLRAVDITMRDSEAKEIFKLIKDRKFLPGGRYLYASGRPYHQVQNCLLLRAEDSREGWADLLNKSAMALMTGAGIGIDYSDVRPEGSLIRKTGGKATGPIALMQMINECGRGIMQGGSRRCLPETTLVTMADFSRKPIKDVEVGDMVATRLGPRKVTNKFDQGVQDVIKVVTEYGEVKSTANHKWLAADRTRRKTWMTAKDLSLNNKIYYHPCPVDDSQRISVDKDYAYMLGYFMGDGCAYSSNRTHEITFQFSNEHYSEEQVEKISEVMKGLGTTPVLRKGHGDCTELRCRSKKLVQSFQLYKTPNQPPNLSEVYNWDNETLSAFLAGWMDADGSFTKDAWRLSNTYITTRKEIQRLAENLGLVTTVSGIDIRFNSYQRAQWMNTIGKYSFKKPKHGINKETSEIPAKIYSVSYSGNVHTWDIEVEGVHEFIADDFVSHNSAIWAGLNWAHQDINKFIRIKDWSQDIRKLKEKNFNFPATLDGTNISVILDDEFFKAYHDEKHPSHTHAQIVYWTTVEQMLRTAEPGFSVDVGENSGESLRNAPVSAGTYVLTKNGYKQVREIINQKTAVWTGKQWAVTEFKQTGEMVPVVKVTMTGGREIICDPTHEFILDNGERVPAYKLKEGQSLKVSLPKREANRLKFYSKDYTLGYLYGDGNFARQASRAEVTLCTEESKNCLPYFNLEMISSVTEKDSRGYARVYMTTNSLYENCYKEVFPEWMYGACESSQASFIAGLFDSDGNYFEPQNRVRLASKHKPFLEGVRRALESLGILSGISTAGISTYGQNQGYMLTVNTEYVNRFKELIPTKRLQIKGCEAYRTTRTKVKSVESAGYEDVYCCDVGVEEHSFMAEGIIISNCTEVTSRDDSDICNLGSINISRIDNLEEMRRAVELGTLFLLAGTVYSDVPYSAVDRTRTKNRRLGLGLMGIHEWLLKRGKPYAPDKELEEYLKVYAQSTDIAHQLSSQLEISKPVKTRAIAPTGSIGIIAETTTGIEPVFCVAFKRRYLKHTTWHYQYVIDPTAKRLIDIGIDPDKIQDAYSLDFKARVEFQAWVQQYVDHGISSTINLPAWGSETNNENTVRQYGEILLTNLPKLRGITTYPDGARGGQPLVPVKYRTALTHTGKELVEETVDVCDISKGGSCGD